jgi:hypothetical protein
MSIVIYNEEKQLLPQISFLKDTSNQVKIREINNSFELTKQLAFVFAEVALLAGIKEEISDFVKKDIKTLILTKYKNLSVDEISYAFRLERYKSYNEITEHYNQFTTSYVSSILDKYVEWKQNTMREKNILIGSPKEKVVTEEERKAIRLQFLKNVYEEVKEYGKSRDAWLLYDELVEKEVLLVGKSVIKELYSREVEIEKERLRNNGLLNDYRSFIKNTDKNQMIINNCKSKLVSECIETEFDNFEQFKNNLYV